MQNQVSKRFIGRRAAAVVAAGLVAAGSVTVGVPVADAQQVFPAVDERVADEYWPSWWFKQDAIDEVFVELKEGEKVKFEHVPNVSTVVPGGFYGKGNMKRLAEQFTGSSDVESGEYKIVGVREEHFLGLVQLPRHRRQAFLYTARLVTQ